MLDPLFKPPESSFKPNKYKGNAHYVKQAEASERSEQLFYNLLYDSVIDFKIKGIHHIDKTNDDPDDWNPDEGTVLDTRGIDLEIWLRHQPKKKIRIHPVIRYENTLNISQSIPSDIKYYEQDDGIYKSLTSIMDWVKSKRKNHIAIFTCRYSINHLNYLNSFYINPYHELVNNNFDKTKILMERQGLLGPHIEIHQNKSGFRIKFTTGAENGRACEWYITDWLAERLLYKNNISNQKEGKNKIIQRFKECIFNYHN